MRECQYFEGFIAASDLRVFRMQGAGYDGVCQGFQEPKKRFGEGKCSLRVILGTAQAELFSGIKVLEWPVST